MNKLRLGVNIDHVATVRNARGVAYPDPIRAAQIAELAGADGITAHLREDRRHIKDEDIFRIKAECALPLNMEMAATEEMLAIALKIKPNAACIVPEKREELTTEGGLEVAGAKDRLKPIIDELKNAGIRVSLFIEPSIKQIEASAELNADIVELHTGIYCHVFDKTTELEKIITAAKYTEEVGIECHGGHGLSYNDVASIAAIPQMVELNIGHFLIGEAIFLGLEGAIKKMQAIMDGARA
jgi:pyridoxine 5-phosphate synthase